MYAIITLENSVKGNKIIKIANEVRNNFNCKIFTSKSSTTGINKPISISKYDQSKENKNNLLIKNLPKNLSSREFYELFRQYGDINKCKINLDYYGVSKCYGYVSYFHEDDYKKALTELVTFNNIE
jgi:RNA recognition motif-containing protein